MDEAGPERMTDTDEFNASATMVYRALPATASPIPDDVWHIHLEVIGGPMDGHRARGPGALFTLGRGAENDLALPIDPMVSGRHALIIREGQHYWLEDLESSNGTFIGDRRLEERTLLGPGTTFRVGQTVLEFMPR